MNRNLSRRRYLMLFCLAAAVGAWHLVATYARAGLWHMGWFTGWSLWVLVLLLVSLNVRKQLPWIPLGNVSTWLQVHIHAGLFGTVVFWWHIGGRWPGGLVETCLAALFAITTVSGLYGLYISRAYPRKLNRVRDQYLWQRFPRLYELVARESQQLVLTTARRSGHTTLADYYEAHLLPYFLRRPAWRFRLLPGAGRRRRVQSGLAQHQRYLSGAERAASERLFDLIRMKDDLDYHFALQWMLKQWLVVHIAASYTLLVAGLLHGMAAWRFLAATTHAAPTALVP